VIRTEEEYRVGLRRLDESKRAITDTHAALLQQGLDAATIDMLLASMRVLQQDVQEEVDAYDRARAFDFGPVPFAGLGRLLIGLRIARHMTVSDLADALATDKGNVSRDEKSDYRGITRERVERILAALNVELMVTPMPKEVLGVRGVPAVAATGSQSAAPPMGTAAGWPRHTAFIPEQPMAWPGGNVQWQLPFPYSPVQGYGQLATNGPEIGAQVAVSTPSASHANVTSSKMLAEAA